MGNAAIVWAACISIIETINCLFRQISIVLQALKIAGVIHIITRAAESIHVSLRLPNFIPFHSFWSFEDTWGLGLPIWYNGDFDEFLKKVSYNDVWNVLK